MISKNSCNITVNREQNRYTLYSCLVDDCEYNIAGVHLPANPNSSSDDRKNIIRDLISDIVEQENNSNNLSTIVIGDFNCNPFDAEVIQKDSFNAVLFKQIIQNQETVLYQNKRYRRFYSPIIHYLSEDTPTYGSYYYNKGGSILIWNSFDQVLVRKKLIDTIADVKYIRSIKKKNLIKNYKPDSSVSDHLPLLVILEGAEE